MLDPLLVTVNVCGLLTPKSCDVGEMLKPVGGGGLTGALTGSHDAAAVIRAPTATRQASA